MKLLLSRREILGRLKSISDTQRIAGEEILKVVAELYRRLDDLAARHTQLALRLDSLEEDARHKNEVLLNLAAQDESVSHVRDRKGPAAVYLGDRILAETHFGLKIFVPPDDIDIAPHIIMDGRWEPHVEKVVRQLLRPGQVAADLGANVGYHTLVIAAAVGPKGRVEAFEPNPLLAQLLASTLFVNGVQYWVRLHETAVTNRRGTSLIAQMPGHFGSGNIFLANPHPAYEEQYPARTEVCSVRLDDALADLSALHLLRMDIEGSEPLALSGAEALVQRSPDLRIVTEWSVTMMSPRSDLPAFVSSLGSQGFRPWIIELDGSLKPLPIHDLLNIPISDVLLSRGEPA